MVVEIDRSILVKEPWITVKNGEVVVRPAIISSISHLPGVIGSEPVRVSVETPVVCTGSSTKAVPVTNS